MLNCHGLWSSKCHINLWKWPLVWQDVKLPLWISVYIYIAMYNSHTRYHTLSCMTKVSYNMTKCHVTYQCVLKPFSIYEYLCTTVISYARCKIVWPKCHLIWRKRLIIYQGATRPFLVSGYLCRTVVQLVKSQVVWPKCHIIWLNCHIL